MRLELSPEDALARVRETLPAHALAALPRS